MKSPKKPTKEPFLPSQDEARRANVLMEQMLSKFDAFGESLSIVHDRVDRMEPDVRQTREDMQLMKLVSDNVRENLRTIKSDVALHGGDLHTIKADIASLKSDVGVLKVDVSEIKGDLKTYNQRVEVV